MLLPVKRENQNPVLGLNIFIKEVIKWQHKSAAIIWGGVETWCRVRVDCSQPKNCAQGPFDQYPTLQMQGGKTKILRPMPMPFRDSIKSYKLS